MKFETNIRPQSRYAQKRAQQEAGIRPEFEFKESRAHAVTSNDVQPSTRSVHYAPGVGPRRLILEPGSEERAIVTCIVTLANLTHGHIYAKTEAGDTISFRLSLFRKHMTIRRDHVIKCRVRCDKPGRFEATRIYEVKPPELFTKRA